MENVTNQHGDVLFVQVNEIPNGAKKLEIKDGWIVEKGEGVHTHVFPDVSNIEVFEKDGAIYVRVKKDATVVHEEHRPQTLSPCIYKKRIEREFDYETMEARESDD